MRPIEYKASLEPFRKQSLPKKVILKKRIPLKSQETPYSRSPSSSGSFECLITFWIPDVPYSSLRPKICLTMQSGYGKIRLVFEDWNDLVNFNFAITEMLIDNKEIIIQKLDEALQEWEECQKKKSCILYYDSNTVLQEEKQVLIGKEEKK